MPYQIFTVHKSINNERASPSSFILFQRISDFFTFTLLKSQSRGLSKTSVKHLRCSVLRKLLSINAKSSILVFQQGSKCASAKIPNLLNAFMMELLQIIREFTNSYPYIIFTF